MKKVQGKGKAKYPDIGKGKSYEKPGKGTREKTAWSVDKRTVYINFSFFTV